MSNRPLDLAALAHFYRYASGGIVPKNAKAAGPKKTVPESINWGPNVPKDYLAYLNKQEMDLVQQHRAFKGRRSHNGIPAFPDPGDTGYGDRGQGTSSSTGHTSSGGYNSGTAGSKGGGASTAGGGSGGSNSGSGGYSGGQGGQDSGSRSSGAGAGQGGQNSGARGAGSNYGAGSGRPGTSSTQGNGGSRGTNGFSAPNPDIKNQQRTQTSDAIRALNNIPSVRSDLSSGGIKSIGVGPMNTAVNVGRPIAGGMSFNGLPSTGQISKSIETYKPSEKALSAVSRGPGSVSGSMPGNTDPVAAQRSIQAITNSLNETFGKNYTPDEIDKMVKTIAGEAASESTFGQAAVANTMLNRISLASQDPEKYGYMGGRSVDSLLGQYDASGMRPKTSQNATYKSSVPGTETYRAAMNALSDASNPTGQFAKTASPEVLAATHYYNPKTADPKWGARSGTSFETVGAHVFGNAEPTQRAVREARSIAPASVSTAPAPVSASVGDFFTPAQANAETAVKGPLMKGNAPTVDNYNVLSGVSVPKTRQPAAAPTPTDFRSIASGSYTAPYNRASSKYSGASFDPSSELQKSAALDAMQGSLYARDTSATVPNTGNVVSAPRGVADLAGAGYGTFNMPNVNRMGKVEPVKEAQPYGMNAPTPTPSNTRIGTEVQGPYGYTGLPGIPSPTGMDMLDKNAATPQQTQAFKDFVGQYTSGMPSLSDVAQAYSSLQPSVWGYRMATSIRGRPAADKLAIASGKAMGVDTSIANGIRSLGGIVENSLIGALSGQAAMSTGGIPAPKVDIEGPQRAQDTMNAAEGGTWTKSYDVQQGVNVVGGLGIMGVNSSTQAPSTFSAAKNQTSAPRDAFYSDGSPPETKTATSLQGGPGRFSSDTILSKDGYGYPTKADGTPYTAEDVANLPQAVQDEYYDKLRYARMTDAPYPLSSAQKTKAFAANAITAPIRFGPIGSALNLLSYVPGEIGTAAGKLRNPGDAVADYERANPLRQQQISERAGKQYKFGDGGGQGGGAPDIGSGGKNDRMDSFTRDTPKSTPTTDPSTDTARPQQYYNWDLGINIPSPGDSEYPLYLKYLQEEAASTAATS